MKAFNGSDGDDRRDFFILTQKSQKGQIWEFYIEMVACGMFGNNGNGGFLNPPKGNKTFTLKKCEIRKFNRIAYNIHTDLSIILDISKYLEPDDIRAWKASECCRKIINSLHTNNPNTWNEAQILTKEFLSTTNSNSQHQVIATGHCHIDTAWLWPYSETRRKVARSWATQCHLMDIYPFHKFVASQAQQFEWIKIKYPILFERIKLKQKLNQFIPIGCTWVEMDCNIPSGESFARQFLYGQRFFKSEFGEYSNVFWLPDTFGYSSQLPQIMKESQCNYFLTQKLSWNNINKFPHNTFIWQGLDGTGVLSHFPPADTYISSANVKDLIEGTKKFKTKDKSNFSMMLFGWGDGGGGPDHNHLERLKRLEDIDGVPKVSLGNPEQFFQNVESEKEQLPKWCGELYFELHRGTYTTHSKNKLYNRRSEFQLTNLEFFSTIASFYHHYNDNKYSYPRENLDKMWKLTLLNQFHDVLPGTSIELVYNDSNKHYQEIDFLYKKLSLKAIHSILGSSKKMIIEESIPVIFNPLAWPRKSIINILDQNSSIKNNEQLSFEGSRLAVVYSQGMGFSKQIEYTCSIEDSVTIELLSDGDILINNKYLKVVFDPYGRIKSLFHKSSNHESISEGKLGNYFVMFEDIPFYWDAWDVEIYHTEKQVSIDGYQNEHSIKILETGPLRASFEFELKISKDSFIKQQVFIDSVSDLITFDTYVLWNEKYKFLKVEYPFNVLANQIWYSTQFGCLSRPNHRNTTWDMAKFEVCAHHWADMSEFGFGVALLNNSKYGYSCLDNVMRLSLLRSPKHPDETADVGEHHFKYAVLPHLGSHADCHLSKRGLEFNQPLEIFNSNVNSAHIKSFFENQDLSCSLILQTVKMAEHSFEQSTKNIIILRLWESLGGRGIAKIKTILPVDHVRKCNILEEEKEQNHDIKIDMDNILIPYKPFEIITLALHLKNIDE